MHSQTISMERRTLRGSIAPHFRTSPSIALIAASLQDLPGQDKRGGKWCEPSRAERGDTSPGWKSLLGPSQEKPSADPSIKTRTGQLWPQAVIAIEKKRVATIVCTDSFTQVTSVIADKTWKKTGLQPDQTDLKSEVNPKGVSITRTTPLGPMCCIIQVRLSDPEELSCAEALVRGFWFWQ